MALVIKPAGSRVKQIFINGKDVSDDNSASTDLWQIEVGENTKNARGNQHGSQNSQFPSVICRNKQNLKLVKVIKLLTHEFTQVLSVDGKILHYSSIQMQV